MKLASCLAFLLGLAVVTQGQAEDYYIYHDPEGKLVISNKEPPPGSKIIRQLPGVTDKEAPQAQAQEPGKTPPTAQTEGSPKPSKNKIARVEPELIFRVLSHLLIVLLSLTLVVLSSE